jgi:hypothetical protein
MGEKKKFPRTLKRTVPFVLKSREGIDSSGSDYEFHKDTWEEDIKGKNEEDDKNEQSRR